MKIWMPTTNGPVYQWACSVSLRLLARYWPDHPTVDVAHFEQRPNTHDLGGVRCIGLGPQQPWVAGMMAYLTNHNADDLVLLMLDDYGICQPVDTDAVASAAGLMRADPSIVSFALTWQPCPVKRRYGRLGERKLDHVCEFGPWPYWVNTQAGIWRRLDLLDILRQLPPDIDVWRMEQAASKAFGTMAREQSKRMVGWAIPDPPAPSPFVDGTDKSGWIVAYHNLVHLRQADPRHREFLLQEKCLP